MGLAAKRGNTLLGIEPRFRLGLGLGAEVGTEAGADRLTTVVVASTTMGGTSVTGRMRMAGPGPIDKGSDCSCSCPKLKMVKRKVKSAAAAAGQPEMPRR